MQRASYLDWLRGLAVILMIETHVFNAWPRPELKVGRAWRIITLVGGAPAPLFLFLAGVSLALLLRGAERAGLTPSGGLLRALRRAAWLFGVAILLRVWFYVAAGARHPEMIGRVDVLNCMAVSLAIAALLGHRAARGRWNPLPAVAGLVLAFTAPLIAAAWPEPWQQELPFAYVYGRRPTGLFPLTPWAGFTLVGLSIGTLWTSTRDPAAMRPIMLGTLVAGLGAIVAGAVLWRHQPALYGSLEPWRTGPAYFLIRVGMLFVAGAVTWAVHLLARPGAWSWVRQLGVTSLFVYVVHLELVYGKLGRPLMNRFDLRETFVAFVLLTAAMLLLSIGKTKLTTWRARARERGRATTA